MNFANRQRSITTAKLDGGPIVNYDLCVSNEESYQEYLEDPRKIFIGKGYIHSVNGTVQRTPEEFKVWCEKNGYPYTDGECIKYFFKWK